MAQKKSSPPAPKVPVVVPNPDTTRDLLDKVVAGLRRELVEVLDDSPVDTDHVRTVTHNIARVEVVAVILDGDAADNEFDGLVSDRLEDLYAELLIERLERPMTPVGLVTVETVKKLKQAVAIAEAALYE